MRVILLFVAIFLLVSCKDLLNSPVQGETVGLSRFPLEGKWIAGEKNAELVLKKLAKPNWFQFTLNEPSRMVEGNFAVAYFKHKFALSVDIASIKINGEALVREGKQGYLLIGVYFGGDEMEIVQANMEKFERAFADYYFAAPIDTASFCPKTNTICITGFASGNLLYSKNRRKFNEDLAKNFRSVFPRRDAIRFVPVAE